jgi:TolA-binding protein
MSSVSSEVIKMKRISISLRDHTYETYIQGIDGNKSAFIDKLICMGGDAIEQPQSVKKSKVIQLLSKITELETEIRRLNKIIERKRYKETTREEELERKKSAIKGILRSGALNED